MLREWLIKRRLRRAVRRGARLLDRELPGWHRQVELSLTGWWSDRPLMASCELCVLGQAFGSYWEGLTFLECDSVELAFRYGFTLPTTLLTPNLSPFAPLPPVDADRWAWLGHLWDHEARKRKEAEA